MKKCTGLAPMSLSTEPSVGVRGPAVGVMRRGATAPHSSTSGDQVRAALEECRAWGDTPPLLALTVRSLLNTAKEERKKEGAALRQTCRKWIWILSFGHESACGFWW